MASGAKIQLVIRRIPKTRLVPRIEYPDGRVSESWDELNAILDARNN